MRATGIIVEYNPFHNGHVYHIEQAKKETKADVIIAVMSGNFLQRGEPSLVDKWARTQMALAGGVDLVFELPYRFATANAPLFASGAIQLLDAVRCDAFCFGSEQGAIASFHQTVSLITERKEQYDEHVQQAMSLGQSYPNALNSAYQHLLATARLTESPIDLSKPNNILGFHYMEAAHRIKSTMKPYTIERIIANYHDEVDQKQQIASASGIRKAYFESTSLSTVHPFLPADTIRILDEWLQKNQRFVSWSLLYPTLRFILLREGPARLKDIADVTEGIEHLLYRAALSCGTFTQFMHTVKSKRYTWTRIQRMLTHILNHFTYEERKKMDRPTYLRLLGMSQKGRQYLNQVKKNTKLPIISKVSSFKNPSLELDIRVADLYGYCLAVHKEEVDLRTDYTNIPLYADRLSSFGGNCFK